MICTRIQLKSDMNLGENENLILCTDGYMYILDTPPIALVTTHVCKCRSSALG